MNFVCKACHFYLISWRINWIKREYNFSFLHLILFYAALYYTNLHKFHHHLLDKHDRRFLHYHLGHEFYQPNKSKLHAGSKKSNNKNHTYNFKTQLYTYNWSFITGSLNYTFTVSCLRMFTSLYIKFKGSLE